MANCTKTFAPSSRACADEATRPSTIAYTCHRPAPLYREHQVAAASIALYQLEFRAGKRVEKVGVVDGSAARLGADDHWVRPSAPGYAEAFRLRERASTAHFITWT